MSTFCVTQVDLLSILEPQFPYLSNGVMIRPSVGLLRVSGHPPILQKFLASWALAHGKSLSFSLSFHHSDPAWEVTALQMPLAQAGPLGPRHCHIW